VKVKKFVALAAMSTALAGAAIPTLVPSAQAAASCSVSVTAFGLTDVVYAHSKAYCSGKVTHFSYTTKLYMYYAGAYRDGAYLGNSHMTRRTSYSTYYGGTLTQSVTAQNDYCQYLVNTSIRYTVGGTPYSKSVARSKNIC
jgi:hypothetical protein